MKKINKNKKTMVSYQQYQQYQRVKNKNIQEKKTEPAIISMTIDAEWAEKESAYTQTKDLA